MSAPAADAGAVIVAAGVGARAGGGEPKQYREIAGVRMLLRAVRPFASHPRVGPIVIVLPEADAASPPSWLASLLSDRLTVVAGGETRQQSVANGLSRLAPEAKVGPDVGTAGSPQVKCRSGHASSQGAARLGASVSATTCSGGVAATAPRA